MWVSPVSEEGNHQQRRSEMRREVFTALAFVVAVSAFADAVDK